MSCIERVVIIETNTQVDIIFSYFRISAFGDYGVCLRQRCLLLDLECMLKKSFLQDNLMIQCNSLKFFLNTKQIR